MDLNRKQKQVLVELCKKGFVANWYQAFGKHKLKVYKQDGGDEYICLTYKGLELEVDTYFPGVSFLSTKQKAKQETYQEAIAVYEATFKPMKH